MNSSKPSGQAQTVVSNDPWEGQAPYLEAGFQDAEVLKNNPLSYYPNSAVVPQSGQTLAALQATQDRALGGSPVLQAGQAQVGATASGAYEGANPSALGFGSFGTGQGAGQGELAKTAAGGYQASNPYLADIVKKATDTAGAGIDARFSKAGRYGSGHHAKSVADTGANIASSVYAPAYEQERQRQVGAAGNLAQTSLSGLSGGSQGYDAERQRMLSAAGMAPGAAGADYDEIARLGGVGAAYESQAGLEMQDAINRYSFNQNAPIDALKNYMAMIGGGSYGSNQTQSQPLYNNPWATGLGIVGTGATIAKDLWGTGGAFA